MRRLLCKLFGHRWLHVDADPVALFPVCGRCGKWSRYYQGRAR